jgi:hypothetical protein
MDAPSLIRQIITPPPPASCGLHLVVGASEIQSLVLYALARPLHAGGRAYWIDAGNAFDAYGLGNVSRAARLDERRVLARLQVARPFTAIQLVGMLTRQLPRIPSGCPVILADPMALFYDHEMPERDVSRIFREFREAVRALTQPLLALAITRPVPEARRHLSTQLVTEARRVAWLRVAAPHPPRLQPWDAPSRPSSS